MATSHYIPSISFLSAPDKGHLGGNALDRESIHGASRTLVVYFPDSKGAVSRQLCLYHRETYNQYLRAK